METHRDVVRGSHEPSLPTLVAWLEHRDERMRQGVTARAMWSGPARLNWSPSARLRWSRPARLTWSHCWTD